MPQPTSDSDRRAAFVSGLRELAHWYEQHPDMPLPYAELSYCVRAGDDAAGRAELERCAALLGAPINDYGGRHPTVSRRFGAVGLCAFYVPQRAQTDYRRRWRIGDAADPVARAAADHPGPLTVTVTPGVTR